MRYRWPCMRIRLRPVSRRHHHCRTQSVFDCDANMVRMWLTADCRCGRVERSCRKPGSLKESNVLMYWRGYELHILDLPGHHVVLVVGGDHAQHWRITGDNVIGAIARCQRSMASNYAHCLLKFPTYEYSDGVTSNHAPCHVHTAANCSCRKLGPQPNPQLDAGSCLIRKVTAGICKDTAQAH